MQWEQSVSGGDPEHMVTTSLEINKPWSESENLPEERLLEPSRALEAIETYTLFSIPR